MSRPGAPKTPRERAVSSRRRDGLLSAPVGEAVDLSPASSLKPRAAPDAIVLMGFLRSLRQRSCRCSRAGFGWRLGRTADFRHDMVRFFLGNVRRSSFGRIDTADAPPRRRRRIDPRRSARPSAKGNEHAGFAHATCLRSSSSCRWHAVLVEVRTMPSEWTGSIPKMNRVIPFTGCSLGLRIITQQEDVMVVDGAMPYSGRHIVSPSRRGSASAMPDHRYRKLATIAVLAISALTWAAILYLLLTYL